MGKKSLLAFALVVVCMLLLPALASATLVNEYGMHYAGEDACISCHSHFSQGSPMRVSPALHGRFANEGVLPAVPEGWTEFQAAGNVTPVPGEGQSLYHAGGSYSLARARLDRPWVTPARWATRPPSTCSSGARTSRP